jgi:hypothetical protein
VSGSATAFEQGQNRNGPLKKKHHIKRKRHGVKIIGLVQALYLFGKAHGVPDTEYRHQ